MMSEKIWFEALAENDRFDCERCIPPRNLYFAVPRSNLEIIKHDGISSLLPGKYLHLTPYADKAKEISKCEGDDTVILKIRAREAQRAGTDFWYKGNVVYLVKKIEPKYIEVNSESAAVD